jgi:hypothetical protein
MDQNINLVERVTWDKTRDTDLLFDPKMETVKLDETDTKWRLLYREYEGGTKKPFSCMTDSYALIPNKDLVNAITSFHEIQLDLDLNLSANSKNSHFQLVFNVDTEENFDDDSKDGANLSPQLVLLNSYNGSTRLKMEFGFFRMICSNMLIIPEVGKTFQVDMKHYKGNFEESLQEQMHKILSNMLSKDVFDSIRGKIERNIKSDDMHIDIKFLKQLPYKQLFLFIGLLAKYSQMYVSTIDHKEGKIYDVSNTTERMMLVDNIVKEKRKDGDNKYDIHWQEKVVKAGEYEYPEEVTNQWALYNMFIKMIQMTVEKQNRMRMTRLASQYLLS